MTARMIVVSLLLCGKLRAQTAPDITVAADGSGQFITVQQAVESISKDSRERIIVYIKDGTYREKVRIDSAFVTLRGQSRKGTRIEFPQLNDDFTKNPDKLGRAVVNVESTANDLVLENLTIANTAGIVGPHAFAIYGKADRTVIVDCDVLSEGADTVSLWKGDTGRYYHARCHFRGAVDFVCPRGWCYITDSTFFETKATAALWHDGSKHKDQKFVLRNCKFDGVEGFLIGRHHHGAQFFLLDCTFSKTMADKMLFRVFYPLDGGTPTTQDVARNEANAKSNIWGERIYFHNCHRDGGDFAWHADNLATAEGSPRPEQITPAWTFGGLWDPQRAPPGVQQIVSKGQLVTVTFTEPVTVKGKPVLKSRDAMIAAYAHGSGTDRLSFTASAPGAFDQLKIDLNGGAIIATQAAEKIQAADLTPPMR
jgi:pectinesterase